MDQRPFDIALDRAESQLADARARLRFAERQVARIRPLVEQGDATPEQLDRRIADRDQARAAVKNAEAGVRDAELDLDYATTRAPFDARVLSESVEPGESVQVGERLAELSPTEAVEIDVPLDSDAASLIAGLWRDEGPRPSAEVRWGYGAHSYRWKAVVARAETEIDQRTRTVRVIVRVPDPETGGQRLETAQAAMEALPGEETPPLLINAFVDVIFEGRSVERFVRVPRSAVSRGVLRIVREDTLQTVAPRIYHETADTVFASAEGLREGDRLITSTLDTAVEGMAVRVREESDKTEGERGRQTSAAPAGSAEGAP
jgi:RND family efflux transporter MFP subunit